MIMLALALALLPLGGAIAFIRKPRQGFACLAIVTVLTVCNAMASKYYDLSPDGGPPERAWFPALLAVYGVWGIFCIVLSMALRHFHSEADSGTGFSPDV